MFRISVQFEHAHINQRIILVRPDLREVERIPTVGFGILLRHDLHAKAPSREIAALDRLEEIAL